LRNHQDSAAYVLNAAVHFPTFIFEDPQPNDFLGKVGGVSLSVGSADAQQNQQPSVNRADPLVDHRDLGTAHALDDGPHLV
jgi:hypothetical protein